MVATVRAGLWVGGSCGCCTDVSRGSTVRGVVTSSDEFVYLDDVWAIDVDTMTWHNPACAGGGPSARYGHTASVIEYK